MAAIKSYDFILISGEPYADHPLSGIGLIARVLASQGWRVGVIGRPDWRRPDDFKRLGRPRLAFAVTSGSIDSLLRNYSPLKRARSRDPHSPYHSGIPDRAVIVYCNLIRHLFPGVPIIIGGVEASLRRLAHYDYWENRVRRSILLDSRADILVYGPGEKQILEIAQRLAEGKNWEGIPGTCVVSRKVPEGFILLPSFEEVKENIEAFVELQRRLTIWQGLAQPHGNLYVLQFPFPEYQPEFIDWVYSLPFSRNIPSDFPELKLAQFSIITHRGCIGRCSFCALSLHQGDRVVSRSEDSILEEVDRLSRHPEFKGIIDDLGGPTANMYGLDCSLPCDGSDCLNCRHLDRSHQRLINLLRRVRQRPGIKKVFVRSGIRFDLAMASPEYLEELINHHLSGWLKIAPEHISPQVLRLMNKPTYCLEEFKKLFERLNKGRKQYLKCYFMVAHPGTTMTEAKKLAEYLKKWRGQGPNPVEGVQIFTPTPMTRSTCMYYTGIDPVTGEKVYVPRSYAEKKEQKRMIFRE
ncbi:MAG: YgiQ family radical SAM protein [Candidatus Aminicenantes bacterium]|nr:YgiQ family radical SAM protein [Candidatus Aminicenantes bacterium]